MNIFSQPLRATKEEALRLYDSIHDAIDVCEANPFYIPDQVIDEFSLPSKYFKNASGKTALSGTIDWRTNPKGRLYPTDNLPQRSVHSADITLQVYSSAKNTNTTVNFKYNPTENNWLASALGQSRNPAESYELGATIAGQERQAGRLALALEHPSLTSTASVLEAISDEAYCLPGATFFKTTIHRTTRSLDQGDNLVHVAELQTTTKKTDPSKGSGLTGVVLRAVGIDRINNLSQIVEVVMPASGLRGDRSRGGATAVYLSDRLSTKDLQHISEIEGSTLDWHIDRLVLAAEAIKNNAEKAGYKSTKNL